MCSQYETLGKYFETLLCWFANVWHTIHHVNWYIAGYHRTSRWWLAIRHRKSWFMCSPWTTSLVINNTMLLYNSSTRQTAVRIIGHGVVTKVLSSISKEIDFYSSNLSITNIGVHHKPTSPVCCTLVCVEQFPVYFISNLFKTMQFV